MAVSPADGYIFVGDTYNHRIQYFTPTGSYLGKWGSNGSMVGSFRRPYSLCFNDDGARLYVTDSDNDRIQYFNRNETALEPISLGRVKALFK